MSQITTHVLDTSIGKPANGINISLEFNEAKVWKQIANGTTDNDGRVKNLLPLEKKIPKGTYRLIFDTRSYFKSNDLKGFYPTVTIEFEISDDTHYHVPLLLNPYGYSTYRGS